MSREAEITIIPRNLFGQKALIFVEKCCSQVKREILLSKVIQTNGKCEKINTCFLFSCSIPSTANTSFAIKTQQLWGNTHSESNPRTLLPHLRDVLAVSATVLCGEDSAPGNRAFFLRALAVKSRDTQHRALHKFIARKAFPIPGMFLYQRLLCRFSTASSPGLYTLCKQPAAPGAKSFCVAGRSRRCPQSRTCDRKRIL